MDIGANIKKRRYELRMSQQELALAQQQAKNDAMALQQNAQMYQADPLPYEVDEAMKQYSPDEIDTAIREVKEETGIDIEITNNIFRNIYN